MNGTYWYKDKRTYAYKYLAKSWLDNKRYTCQHRARTLNIKIKVQAQKSMQETKFCSSIEWLHINFPGGLPQADFKGKLWYLSVFICSLRSQSRRTPGTRLLAITFSLALLTIQRTYESLDPFYIKVYK